VKCRQAAAGRVLAARHHAPWGRSRPNASSAPRPSPPRKLVYPKAAEQKRLRQQRRPVVSKALVVNLATGDKREFDRVRRVAFGGDTPQWLAMQAFGPDAPAGGGGAGGAGGPAPGAPGMGGNPLGGGGGRVEGTDMLLYELGTSALFNVGNVADFAFDNKGRWLAYAIDAREQAGNGVQLRELATGVVKSIDAGKALYRRLAWSDTLNALAFVKGTADSAATDTAWTAVGVSRVGAPTQQGHAAQRHGSEPRSCAALARTAGCTAHRSARGHAAAATQRTTGRR